MTWLHFRVTLDLCLQGVIHRLRDSHVFKGQSSRVREDLNNSIRWVVSAFQGEHYEKGRNTEYTGHIGAGGCVHLRHAVSVAVRLSRAS